MVQCAMFNVFVFWVLTCTPICNIRTATSATYHIWFLGYNIQHTTYCNIPHVDHAGTRGSARSGGTSTQGGEDTQRGGTGGAQVVVPRASAQGGWVGAQRGVAQGSQAPTVVPSTPPRSSRTRVRTTSVHRSRDKPKRTRAAPGGRRTPGGRGGRGRGRGAGAPPILPPSPPCLTPPRRALVRHRSVPVTPVPGEQQSKRLKAVPQRPAPARVARGLGSTLATMLSGHGRSSTSST